MTTESKANLIKWGLAAIIIAAFLFFITSCSTVQPETRQILIGDNGEYIPVQETEQIVNGQIVPKIYTEFDPTVTVKTVQKYGHSFLEFSYWTESKSGLFSVTHDPNCLNPKHPENQLKAEPVIAKKDGR